ncbi:MAG: serine/threonine protein kinase [Deltaproteobacteria bacterium]|nr:serine/threonine protein kinase [Deltaproteobacteria bacterium]
MRSKEKKPNSRAPGVGRENDPAYISGYEPTRSVRLGDEPGLAHQATEAVHLSGLEATEAVHLDLVGGLDEVQTEPTSQSASGGQGPPHSEGESKTSTSDSSFSVPLHVDHAAFSLPASVPASTPSSVSPSAPVSPSVQARPTTSQERSSGAVQHTSHLRAPSSKPQGTEPDRQRRKNPRERHDPNIGRQLGSYRLLSLLGAGGMGQVYKAEHVMLGRKVALKLLRPEYAVKRDAVHRFFQEARAVNAIGHENIVDITDYVELETGETFFIMELLEGQDLGDLLRDSEEPISLHHAMHIALAVCEALHAAHQTEIIHRDLKPDNIFIVTDARRLNFVKLLDFGVAKLQGEASGQASYQTVAGSVIGTPAYMSPEQASGLPVDCRTDIYSLGAILYEMFTGRPVFNAKSFGEFVVKHMNDQPIPPRDLKGAPKIPIALEQVILRCLEKDPADRYPTVEALREDLARATATVETSLRLAEAPRERRHRWVAIPVALGLFALAAVAFLIASGIWGGGGGTADQSTTPSVSLAAPADDLSPTSAETPKHDPKSPPMVSLHTRPAGAEVFKKGSSQLVGKTPFKVRADKLGRARQRVTLVFKLPGHQELEKTLTLDDEQDVINIDGALEPLPAPNPKRIRRAKVKVKRHIKRNVRKKRPPTKRTTVPTKKVGKTDQVDPFAP